MSSKSELDEGIKSIKSAWQRERTARANLEKMLENAESENAKLREERDMYRDLVGYMVHPDIPDQLAAENAKLRELVRDMYKRMDVSCQFGHAVPAGTMAHIKNRAIGLGIEVDG